LNNLITKSNGEVLLVAKEDMIDKVLRSDEGGETKSDQVAAKENETETTTATTPNEKEETNGQ